MSIKINAFYFYKKEEIKILSWSGPGNIISFFFIYLKIVLMFREDPISTYLHHIITY